MNKISSTWFRSDYSLLSQKLLSLNDYPEDFNHFDRTLIFFSQLFFVKRRTKCRSFHANFLSSSTFTRKSADNTCEHIKICGCLFLRVCDLHFASSCTHNEPLACRLCSALARRRAQWTIKITYSILRVLLIVLWYSKGYLYFSRTNLRNGKVWFQFFYMLILLSYYFWIQYERSSKRYTFLG